MIANRGRGLAATAGTYQVCRRRGLVVYNGGVAVRPGAEKVLVWTIVGSIAFALGMYLFIDNRITAAKEAAQKETAAQVAQHEKRGPSMLDGAAAVASPFVAHVGAGRFADAYALLAAPYRSAVTEDAFAKACRGSPLLAGARSVTLNRLRQQSAGTAATVEASGVLDSSAGAVPIAFVFLVEAGRPRILVVSLAGVPVLQGVAPR